MPFWFWLLAILSVSIHTQSQTSIRGVVEDANGSPKKSALVTFYPYGPSTGIQKKSYTNEKGEFSLMENYNGSGLLSASKVDEGYPDAVIAFYPLNAYKSAQEVTLKGLPLTGLLLKFSDPSPRIELAFTFLSQTPSSLRITVRSVSRPNVYSTTSWDPANKWTFVIPKDPVTISLTAPGYESWTYTTGHGVAPANGVVFLNVEIKKIADSGISRTSGLANVSGAASSSLLPAGISR